MLDNGSVFTRDLVGVLEDLSPGVQCVRADSGVQLDLEQFDSFILSGRRINNPGTNVLNSRIIRHCVSDCVPLLGICYGAEMIALATGGAIRRMVRPHTGEETVSMTGSNPLYNGAITVYESHRFEISRLGESVSSIGASDVCANEVIHIKDSKIFGTQFHPELTPDGRDLIERFVRL